MYYCRNHEHFNVRFTSRLLLRFSIETLVNLWEVLLHLLLASRIIHFISSYVKVQTKYELNFPDSHMKSLCEHSGFNPYFLVAGQCGEGLTGF